MANSHSIQFDRNYCIVNFTALTWRLILIKSARRGVGGRGERCRKRSGEKTKNSLRAKKRPAAGWRGAETKEQSATIKYGRGRTIKSRCCCLRWRVAFAFASSSSSAKTHRLKVKKVSPRAIKAEDNRDLGDPAWKQSLVRNPRPLSPSFCGTPLCSCPPPPSYRSFIRALRLLPAWVCRARSAPPSTTSSSCFSRSSFSVLSPFLGIGGILSAGPDRRLSAPARMEIPLPDGTDRTMFEKFSRLCERYREPSLIILSSWCSRIAMKKELVV